MITDEQYIEAQEIIKKYEQQPFEIIVDRRVTGRQNFWFHKIPKEKLNVRIITKDDGEVYYTGFGEFYDNNEWYIINDGLYKNRIILRGVCNKV